MCIKCWCSIMESSNLDFPSSIQSFPSSILDSKSSNLHLSTQISFIKPQFSIFNSSFSILCQKYSLFDSKCPQNSIISDKISLALLAAFSKSSLEWDFLVSIFKKIHNCPEIIYLWRLRRYMIEKIRKNQWLKKVNIFNQIRGQTNWSFSKE